MLKLSGFVIDRLGRFAPVIYKMSTGYKAEVLVVGAILAMGQRTVSAVLGVMGLLSLGTLLADSLIARHGVPTRTAYPKPLPTFSDALALVRSHLWAHFTSH